MVERITLRRFRTKDLQTLIDYWNRAFSDKRNFSPITPETFRSRILDAEATDPQGLILAWFRSVNGGQGGFPPERGETTRLADSQERLVGMVHAFKPPPARGLYRNWTPNHHIALFHVHPRFRRQGIGSRLLQAAEDWLHYCPVHVANRSQPVYGTVEGPRPPFFGSSDRLALSARNSSSISFLARRGYIAVDTGDVTMVRSDPAPPPPPHPDEPPPPALASGNLRPILFSHENPFQGREARELATVSRWGHNNGNPYWGIGVVDDNNVLHGHLAWYPSAVPGKVALVNFRVEPAYRAQRIGSYLLDSGLRLILDASVKERRAGSLPAFNEPVQEVELEVNLTHNDAAVRLYRRRGFEVADAWVNLVKT